MSICYNHMTILAAYNNEIIVKISFFVQWMTSIHVTSKSRNHSGLL